MNDSHIYRFAIQSGNFAVIDYRDKAPDAWEGNAVVSFADLPSGKGVARDDLLAVLDDLNDLQAQGFQIVSATPDFIWLARSPQQAQSHEPDTL